jgi:phosphoribosyl-ATP pyrophosphohydrolase/phosphoribosyl-AMP cyclohydrolase
VKFAADGLAPCVVQDALSGEVITLAYINETALAKTLATGETHFWSRSRNELWPKGETSGNVQHVRRLALDCDHDAVLVQVAPTGPACHTGAVGCFRDEANGGASGAPAGADAASLPPFLVVSDLVRVIAERAEQRPDGSYTARLLADQDLALKKVGEEATEVVLAAKGGDKAQVVYESADLIYHLLVALRAADVSLEDVWAELASRRR